MFAWFVINFDESCELERLEQNFEVATSVVGSHNAFHGFLREININEAKGESRAQSDGYCRKVVEHSLNPVEI